MRIPFAISCVIFPNVLLKTVKPVTLNYKDFLTSSLTYIPFIPNLEKFFAASLLMLFTEYNVPFVGSYILVKQKVLLNEYRDINLRLIAI